MDIREIVQRNITYYIKQSDYTQADLARMLEVSKTTVTNWVKGVNSPNIEYLSELCNILQIKFSDMFEEHPEAGETLAQDEQQLVTDYRSFSDEIPQHYFNIVWGILSICNRKNMISKKNLKMPVCFWMK